MLDFASLHQLKHSALHCHSFPANRQLGCTAEGEKYSTRSAFVRSTVPLSTCNLRLCEAIASSFHRPLGIDFCALVKKSVDSTEAEKTLSKMFLTYSLSVKEKPKNPDIGSYTSLTRGQYPFAGSIKPSTLSPFRLQNVQIWMPTIPSI